MDWIHLAHDKD